MSCRAGAPVTTTAGGGPQYTGKVIDENASVQPSSKESSTVCIPLDRGEIMMPSGPPAPG